VAGLGLEVWAARGAVMAMQQKASVNERMGFLCGDGGDLELETETLEYGFG
jgi:hypothetical protein